MAILIPGAPVKKSNLMNCYLVPYLKCCTLLPNYVALQNLCICFVLVYLSLFITILKIVTLR